MAANATAQVREFMHTLEENTSLQAQFATAAPNNLDGVVDFANAQGFMITRDELEETLKRYPNSSIADQLKQYVR